MKLTPMNCSNCGAHLQIDPEEEHVRCPFCGTVYTVRRSGTTIGLRRIAESLDTGLGGVASGVGQIATEMRIPRLKEEREQILGRINDCFARKDRLWEDQKFNLLLGVFGVASAIFFLFKVATEESDLATRTLIGGGSPILLVLGLWFLSHAVRARRQSNELDAAIDELVREKLEYDRVIDELTSLQ